MTGTQPGGRRVFVHVGTPKTGTSFVQDVLWLHRDSLAERGILYPGDRFDAHFLAALDLMELHWGGLEAQAVGAWDRLASQVREWPGTSIVSHEVLATASRGQVARALASFGEDAEVHVVVSARDLVRQIPAEWQENVKHRRPVGYRDFLARITDPARAGELASWFWGVQEVPDILARWAGTLPPGRVHLVTVPRPGAPRDLLWQRFSGVFGLESVDPGRTNRSNVSLGANETALVRRINERVNAGVLVNEDYRRLVRELLAHRTLSRRTDSPRVGLPPDVRAWAVELCERWIEELGSRGYDVVGSLDELRPDPAPDAPFLDPDHPDETAVSDAALDAVVALLAEAAGLHGSQQRLAEELEVAYVELERSRSLWFRAKRRLVLLSGEHRSLALGLAVYRRVRGSSSRSA